MPKSPTIDLDALSVSQLAKLQAAIPSVLKRKTDEAQDAFRQKLARMAKDEGYDAFKLFANGAAHAPAAKTSKGKIQVKYRNPANGSETWTGRGREPRWLAALTKSGHTREEYRV